MTQNVSRPVHPEHSSYTEGINQSINQTIKQSINQLINQLINYDFNPRHKGWSSKLFIHPEFEFFSFYFKVKKHLLSFLSVNDAKFLNYNEKFC